MIVILPFFFLSLVVFIGFDGKLLMGKLSTVYFLVNVTNFCLFFLLFPRFLVVFVMGKLSMILTERFFLRIVPSDLRSGA